MSYRNERLIERKTGTTEGALCDWGLKDARFLVKNLYDPGVVGKQQFAKSVMVQERLSREKLNDTPRNRGLLLRRIVEGIIEKELTLYPDNVRPRMLHEIVFSGKTKYHDLADIFLMSDRSIQRYLREAYSLLGRRLMETEDKAYTGKSIFEICFPDRESIKPITIESRGKTNYEHYLRVVHPDWDEDKIKERLAVTDEILRDLRDLSAQSG